MRKRWMPDMCHPHNPQQARAMSDVARAGITRTAASQPSKPLFRIDFTCLKWKGMPPIDAATLHTSDLRVTYAALSAHTVHHSQTCPPSRMCVSGETLSERPSITAVSLSLSSVWSPLSHDGQSTNQWKRLSPLPSQQYLPHPRSPRACCAPWGGLHIYFLHWCLNSICVALCPRAQLDGDMAQREQPWHVVSHLRAIWWVR